MESIKIVIRGMCAAATVLAVGAAGTALGADKDWKKDHPRRAQVNQRLNNQNARIHKEVKSGEISKGQAAQLHKEDRSIRRQERADAAKNGGHITKTEQRQLNREENSVSRQIGK